MTQPLPDARATAIAEAADWHARLRSGDVSEVEAVRFRAWLARSPVHRHEFEKIDGMMENLAALSAAPEIAAERARMRFGSPRLRRLALAASVLIASAGVFWFSASRPDRYATGIGEQRIIPLPDGSVVTLDTATRIQVFFSSAKRDVELIGGQANFKVAQDAVRPFVVTAGAGEVRALGTVFDVYKRTDRVTVTLIEGKVAVRAGQRETPAVLAVGEQLSYGTVNGVLARRSANLERAGAWRDRRLDFSDTPVTEAIAEANRYSRMKIELDAPRLAGARISGTFEAGRNDLFAEGLQSYFGLQAERVGEERIVLTAPR